MTNCVHIAVSQDMLWMCPHGEIDSANVLLLEDAFWLARTYGCRKTFLDLSRLQFISSAGLGQIIHALGALADDESSLILGHMTEPVRLALTSIGLDQFMDTGYEEVPPDSEVELYGIIVPGDLHELKTVRDFLEKTFHQLQYDDLAGYGLKMAVDELVSNVIRHNYNGVSGKPVTVLLSKKDGLLETSVIDQGFAFDPTSHQGRGFTDTIVGGHNNGMGINLVRKLSDSFEYENKEGHNIAHITKALAAVQPEPRSESQSQ